MKPVDATTTRSLECSQNNMNPGIFIHIMRYFLLLTNLEGEKMGAPVSANLRQFKGDLRANPLLLIWRHIEVQGMTRCVEVELLCSQVAQ